MKGNARILVVGGGIAGMACSIGLAKHGAVVTLVDLDPEWRVYGAGITITGPTLRALRQLGVMDEVLTEGFACRGARTRMADGTLLQEVIEVGLDPVLPFGGGILRPALHRILAARVRKSAAAIRLGITVDALSRDEGGVDVRFSDGSTGRYDLVVGADGIFSRVRSMIMPEMDPPRFTGQGAWRVLAPRPTGLDMIEMYLGDGVKAGITPVSDHELYMFVLTRERSGTIIPTAEQPSLLRAALAGFGGLIGKIRDTLGPESSIVYRPLQTILAPAPWNRGAVVLIGDAAHATTPHLASGAGCAIEDAIVLVEELQAAKSISDALNSFSNRRFERCRDVVETSIRLGEMELSGGSGELQSRIYAEANKRLAEAI